MPRTRYRQKSWKCNQVRVMLVLANNPPDAALLAEEWFTQRFTVIQMLQCPHQQQGLSFCFRDHPQAPDLPHHHHHHHLQPAIPTFEAGMSLKTETNTLLSDESDPPTETAILMQSLMQSHHFDLPPLSLKSISAELSEATMRGDILELTGVHFDSFEPT